MSNLETYEISAYTVPSTWNRQTMDLDDRPALATCLPYRRIVGLEGSFGGMLWDVGAHGDPEGWYDVADATKESFQVDNELHSRLSDFFVEHYANATDGSMDYNCHYFAACMAYPGNAANYKPAVYPDAVQDLMETMTLSKAGVRLPLGRWGIYGGYAGATPLPSHSVIGLGETSEDVLQVAAWGGHLGLGSYAVTAEQQRINTESLAPFLAPDGPSPVTAYGLYS